MKLDVHILFIFFTFYFYVKVNNFFTLIPHLKAHVLISNLTSSRLKLTMKNPIPTAESSSIHAENIEVLISNIRIFIICLIQRIGALISDISTYAFKRGIRVLTRKR